MSQDDAEQERTQSKEDQEKREKEKKKDEKEKKGEREEKDERKEEEEEEEEEERWATVSEACHPLLLAVQDLELFSSSEQFAYSKAQISPQGRTLQQGIVEVRENTMLTLII